MIRFRTTGLTTLAATLAVVLAAPLAAQSQTSPPHAGYPPSQRVGGHYHEGEIGDMLLTLEQKLRCNCSCGLDVHSCQFQMQCDVSPGWTQYILQQLQAGESVEAVEASFVAEFGTSVLMSPPPEGFNLVGYFLPAVAIVTAGMLIGLIVRGGAGRSTPAPVHELNDEDATRLRDALRKLDEAEGPDW